jgi:hypothetical protein
MNAAERERHAALIGRLGPLVLETRELPQGYAFRFAAREPIVEELAEWVALERLCCPFLRFTIEEESGGPLWLGLTG